MSGESTITFEGEISYMVALLCMVILSMVLDIVMMNVQEITGDAAFVARGTAFPGEGYQKD